MIGKKRKKQTVNCIEVNGDLTQDPEIIANGFNNYFVNVGPDLAKKIPDCNKKATDYLQNRLAGSMYFSPATDEEVLDIISGLKNTNSLGHDNIPNKVVKYCKSELAHIICHIVNQSMADGVFPELLKTAKIVPVFKSENDKLVNNYRPISILTTFSKIFEKAVFARLGDYMEKYKILHENQFGFRKGLSTCTALLQLVDELANSIDHGQTTVGVFVDLAKAFDTVDHRILLQKLEHYGIRGVVLKWFNSYISNRKQCVLVNSTISKLSNIKCGVPQGSILGPILFILYINDLTHVSHKLKNIMFADDTNLFLTGKSINEVENEMNSELAKVNIWFQANLLSLNVKKTSYMIFGNSKNKTANIYIDNILLNRQYDTKFLGVILSANLKWNKHIDVVVSKASKNIGIIAKVRHLLPQKLTRNLYFTLVHPYVNYCNLIWASPVKSVQLERILKVQKKYCRLITFSNFVEHSRPLFVRLCILNVYEIHKLLLLSHIYAITNGLTKNEYSQQYYIVNSDIHQYNTRQKNNLHIPNCRTSTKQNTISFQGPKLWNSLPMDVRSSPSIMIFKRKVRKYLLNEVQ